MSANFQPYPTVLEDEYYLFRLFDGTKLDIDYDCHIDESTKILN